MDWARARCLGSPLSFACDRITYLRPRSVQSGRVSGLQPKADGQAGQVCLIAPARGNVGCHTNLLNTPVISGIDRAVEGAAAVLMCSSGSLSVSELWSPLHCLVIGTEPVPEHGFDAELVQGPMP